MELIKDPSALKIAKAALLDYKVEPLLMVILYIIRVFLLPVCERVSSGAHIHIGPGPRARIQPGEDVRAGIVLGRVGLAVPIKVAPGNGR